MIEGTRAIAMMLQEVVWKRLLQLLLEQLSPTLHARTRAMMNYANAPRKQVQSHMGSIFLESSRLAQSEGTTKHIGPWHDD